MVVLAVPVFAAVDFAAVVFAFAGALAFALAGALALVFGFAGPLARLSASSSTARSKSMSSTDSLFGIVALVSPSVTYGPKRPSFTLMPLPLTGSASNSFSALDGRRAPYLGCANTSSAPGRSISKICSSLVSERESVPFFRYGPYLPFCAVMGVAVSGSSPTTRGRSSRRSAVSRSTVARSIDLKMEAVRGLTAGAFFAAGFLAGAFFAGAAVLAADALSSTSPVAGSTPPPGAAGASSGSGSSSVTYGP